MKNLKQNSEPVQVRGGENTAFDQIIKTAENINNITLSLKKMFGV